MNAFFHYDWSAYQNCLQVTYPTRGATHLTVFLTECFKMHPSLESFLVFCLFIKITALQENRIART